jgi:hypothetical protein
MIPIAPIGTEIMSRAAYSPWSMRTTKAVNNVATRIMTKKTDLNSQCTPTNWPQSVQTTSEKISPVAEIDSLEQLGHFLLNAFAPLFSTVCFGSAAVAQTISLHRPLSGVKRSLSSLALDLQFAANNSRSCRHG